MTITVYYGNGTTALRIHANVASWTFIAKNTGIKIVESSGDVYIYPLTNYYFAIS